MIFAASLRMDARPATKSQHDYLKEMNETIHHPDLECIHFNVAGL